MNEKLLSYLNETILPEYDNYDKGHDRSHILQVVEAARELSQDREVNIEMLLCSAYFHDLGLCEGRATHHLSSAKMFREDEFMLSYFSDQEITIIAEAIEDHRASAKMPPRSIYGEILSSADRIINIDLIIKRSFYHSDKYHSGSSLEEHVERIYRHIKDKYGESGYLRVPILTECNRNNLSELRKMLEDEQKFKNYCVNILKSNNLV